MTCPADRGSTDLPLTLLWPNPMPGQGHNFLMGEVQAREGGVDGSKGPFHMPESFTGAAWICSSY